MATAAPALDNDALAPGELVRIWALHFVSLLFPLTTLAFLWTGPHAWYIGPLFIVPLVLFQLIDSQPIRELRQPAEALPAWPFDLLVYLLSGLHFLIVIEMGRMFSQQSFFSIDMLMVFVLVGGNAGFSIITAHELIHRRKGWEQLLGRLLLSTVLYEHFYTEHLRGHHTRVGTADDPATARFGETYVAFWRRTVPAQFKSAWKLEAKRLGDAEMSLFDTRMLKNRILHGILVGWGIGAALGLAFGWVAFAAYVLQAIVAIRLLEAVNYFEHWGLRRTSRRVRPVDSWDTHSWFTYYGMTGLSRHADHHANPTRPYQQLRVFEEAPVLPVGYVALVDMVIARNDEFRALATGELERRELGPFAEGAVPEPPAENPPGRLAWLTAPFGVLPEKLRPAAISAVLLALVSLGAAFEAGALGDFTAVLIRNLCIVGIAGGLLFLRRAVQSVVQNEWISWATVLVLLVLAGRLTAGALGA
jgi:alkane 1-monooxygenase